jgi:hypothetical protein
MRVRLADRTPSSSESEGDDVRNVGERADRTVAYEVPKAIRIDIVIQLDAPAQTATLEKVFPLVAADCNASRFRNKGRTSEVIL